MEKQIILKIKVDVDNDNVMNVVDLHGFENGNLIQNTIELVGWLEFVQQQELKKLFEKQVSK